MRDFLPYLDSMVVFGGSYVAKLQHVARESAFIPNQQLKFKDNVSRWSDAFFGSRNRNSPVAVVSILNKSILSELQWLPRFLTADADDDENFHAPFVSLFVWIPKLQSFDTWHVRSMSTHRIM